jgi:branched-chain amino acid aminotransferase
MRYVFCNNTFVKNDSPVFLSNNKSFRYGDGFFETIRVVNGTIPLWQQHSKRIQYTLQILGGNLAAHENADTIYNNVLKTCAKNGESNAARVRVSFYGGNGGLTDVTTGVYHYIIESFALQEGHFSFNQNGLILGMYNAHKKLSNDVLSNIKSSNFLVYALAAKYAKNRQLNDVIVLNEAACIADTSMANIYMVKHNQMYTPHLHDGAIQGCLRSYLLEQPALNIIEKNITVDDILQADEVFISNAVLGIRWVKQIEDTVYPPPTISASAYKQFIAPLFQTS